MKRQREDKKLLNALLRDENGAIAVTLTLMIPVFAGFLTLAVDAASVYTTKNHLQAVADAAALAATFQLSNYQTYSSTSTPGCVGPPNSLATPCSAAQLMAKANNNNVSEVSNSNVIVGNWVSSTSTFTPWTGPYNAVKVTATATSSLTFASLINIFTSPTVSATAIAEYGNNATGSTPWNLTIVQDVSSSFNAEVGQPGTAGSNSKLASLDIINCLSPTSKYGLVEFTGSSPNPPAVPLTLDTPANFSTLKTDVNNMGDCQYSNGHNGVPPCSGSNFAAGMTEAINVLQAAKTTGTQSAMVIITDGQPNCGSGSGGGCTDASIKQAAQNAAATANTDGISVFVLYYSGDSTSNSQDEAFLQTLVKGKGQLMVAPTGAQIATGLGPVCQGPLGAPQLVQ